MKRFAMTVFAAFLVGCPGQTSEDKGYAYFPPAEPPPAADRSNLRMVADSSGHWVIAPTATSERRRLVLIDMTTRTARVFDDLLDVRTASFWNAERGHGIDVVSRVVVGSTAVLSIVSYDLDANTIVFRRDLRDHGDGAPIEIVPSGDTLLVRSGGRLVTIDARTGANIGAFDAPGAFISSMTPVTATTSIAMATTEGPVVLRAHDVSPQCGFADLKKAIPTGNGVAVGSLAFIPLNGSPTGLAVIDTSRCEKAALVQGGPKVVAVEGGVATVVDQSVAVIDATTLTPSLVPLEEDVLDLVASADGKKVVTFEANDVRVIDVATRTASAPIALSQPRYLAASPDGRWIYASSDAPGDLALAVIDVNAAAVSRFTFGAPVVEAAAPANFDGVVVPCDNAELCITKHISLVDRATGATTLITP